MSTCTCVDRWSGPCDACTDSQDLPGLWEHADFIGGQTDSEEDA